MRNSVKRALALVTSVPVLAGTLLATAPAAQATTAPTCGLGSTAIADFYTLGGYHTRIASNRVSSTVTHLCIELFGSVQTVVTLNTGVAVTPPSVTQTSGVGTCAQRIIDMTAPISFALSVGVSASGPAICLGQNGITTTVSFNAASVQTLPDVDVWTLRGTTLNRYAACIDEYALYVSGQGSYTQWYDCLYYRDNQIV